MNDEHEAEKMLAEVAEERAQDEEGEGSVLGQCVFLHALVIVQCGLCLEANPPRKTALQLEVNPEMYDVQGETYLTLPCEECSKAAGEPVAVSLLLTVGEDADSVIERLELADQVIAQQNQAADASQPFEGQQAVSRPSPVPVEMTTEEAMGWPPKKG